MRIMKFLGMGKKSASVAKDRLRIIIAQERAEKDSPDFLPMLRKDILAAIAKYTNVDLDQVHVDLQTRDNDAVLELNVVLPSKAEEAPAKKPAKRTRKKTTKSKSETVSS